MTKVGEERERERERDQEGGKKWEGKVNGRGELAAET